MTFLNIFTCGPCLVIAYFGGTVEMYVLYVGGCFNQQNTETNTCPGDLNPPCV